MRDQKLRPTADGLEREKSPAPSGIQTHDLSDMRCALYRCETTAAKKVKDLEIRSLDQNLRRQPEMRWS